MDGMTKPAAPRETPPTPSGEGQPLFSDYEMAIEHLKIIWRMSQKVVDASKALNVRGYCREIDAQAQKLMDLLIPHPAESGEAARPAQGAGTGQSLEQQLASVLNRCSAENASNTPDFILAQFLSACLLAWNTGVQQRETWYGRDARPGTLGGLVPPVAQAPVVAPALTQSACGPQATCQTHGHIFGHKGTCVFCGTPRVGPDARTEPVLKDAGESPVLKESRHIGVQSSTGDFVETSQGQQGALTRERVEQAVREALTPDVLNEVVRQADAYFRNRLGITHPCSDEARRVVTDALWPALAPVVAPPAGRDFVFSCPSCGHPSAQTVEVDVDIHAGATYRCDRCHGEVIFTAQTPDEYAAEPTRVEGP